MKTIILDDYNQNIPKEQDVIGAVTTTWGASGVEEWMETNRDDSI